MTEAISATGMKSSNDAKGDDTTKKTNIRTTLHRLFISRGLSPSGKWVKMSVARHFYHLPLDIPSLQEQKQKRQMLLAVLLQFSIK